MLHTGTIVTCSGILGGGMCMYALMQECTRFHSARLDLSSFIFTVSVSNAAVLSESNCQEIVSEVIDSD